MTTAHRPTFHPAVGKANTGGYRYHAPRQQFSSRDLPGHTEIKLRQEGQGSESELAIRDLRRELEEREKIHYEKVNTEKRRLGLLTDAPSSSSENQSTAPDSGGGGPTDLSQFDDADDSSSSSEDEEDSDDSSDEDEDEEAELLRELARIKKEREEQALKEEEEKRAQLEMQEREEVLSGNPLLDNLGSSSSSSFNVKRRWDDGVVFKNQAKDEPTKKKRFINDTIRSDFHRNFLKRYIH